MYKLFTLSASKFSIIFSCICLLISFNLLSEENKSPKFIEGVTLLGAEEVLSLIARIDNVIVVDSRIQGDRRKGYLESSVSLPDIETSCATLKNIIPNKSRHAVFYCNGVKCGRSAIAINIAKKCGYKNLYWFRGGFEVWMEKGFPFVKE